MQNDLHATACIYKIEISRNPQRENRPCSVCLGVKARCAAHSPPPASGHTYADGTAAAAVCMPAQEAEDPDKWRRALIKKIRQVEELLARRERGEVLNERQVEKVAREASLRSALAAAEAEGAGQQAAPTVAEPASTPTVAATAAAATSAATPAQQGGNRAPPDLPSHQLTCNHCGRSGHEARGCTFGLAVGENFLFCQRTEPRPCLPRTFIVPLRRAAAAFDPAAPRAEGRVDVGLRCASSALFRSQSLRQNTQVTLCFLGGGQGGGQGGGSAAEAAPRLVEVRGAPVLRLLWPRCSAYCGYSCCGHTYCGYTYYARCAAPWCVT